MSTRFEPVTTMLNDVDDLAVENVEWFLDHHRLGIVSVRNGRWYRIRRNGKTKLWKRDQRTEIPCKVGFRECFTLRWDTNGRYIPSETLAAEN